MDMDIFTQYVFILNKYDNEKNNLNQIPMSSNDNKIIQTVEKLAETAEKNGIRKTALICIGGFLGDNYSLSRLYDSAFETAFRKAKQ